MRRILAILGLLITACTSPNYPVDRPSTSVSEEDRNVIAYIDQRLEDEYYWLDEVIQRSNSFNRMVDWENYLDDALSMLTTNKDDGYINNKGQRVFYSYVREANASTRAAEVNGYGIRLYYTIISIGNDRLGLVVDYIYADSPAALAGIKRGDIIVTVDGNQIDMNNYARLFNSIQGNTATELKLGIFRQVVKEDEAESYAVELKRAPYHESPIAMCDILDIDNYRIGYLAYTQFVSAYDKELLAALEELSAKDIDHFILDLRSNGGGAVNSATQLVSAILGGSYDGKLLCELRRNPLNKKDNTNSMCYLADLGFGINPESITIICSENTASASELVITGLQGLDVPVTLIGSTTEGKNCGMDVTRRSIGDKYIEFAPITFMCYNAKGFGAYGDGIAPDVNVAFENVWECSDEYYPLPRCDWGDIDGDVALEMALSFIVKCEPEYASATRSELSLSIEPQTYIERPFIGATLDCEE